MKSLMRASFFATVVFCFTNQSFSQAAEYCPVQNGGTFGGLTYYYCLDKATCAIPKSLPGTGVTLDGCPCAAPLTDDIKNLLVVKLDRYVPPQNVGGEPGEGKTSGEGSFQQPLDVLYFTISLDEVIHFKKNGTDYYFRVIQYSVVPKKLKYDAATFRIGQELDPNIATNPQLVPASKIHEGELIPPTSSSPSTTRHKIKPKDSSMYPGPKDKEINVISFREIP